MRTRECRKLASVLTVLLLLTSAVAGEKSGLKPRLRQDRGEISAIDLSDMAWGASHQPGMHFRFLKESTSGTSPKFEVEDENGVRWKVKLGPEVKPEVAAARLLWAAGYFVDEDYYRASITVDGMKRLTRGREYVRNHNVVLEARLERHRKGPDPATWSWYNNPFQGTPEFDGLRIMMALLGNWDLKEVNNAIYDEPDGPVYAVADLGATLGRTGNSFSRSKGVLSDYASAPFILKTTDQYVDFAMFSRPFFMGILDPLTYAMRAKMESIPHNVPIQHVRWFANIVGGLSEAQIGDCFTAAGYDADEAQGFASTVFSRIDALRRL